MHYVWIDELEVSNICLVLILLFEFSFLLLVIIKLQLDRLLYKVRVYFATVALTRHLRIVWRLDLLF